jgi:hypothetical protein
VCPAIKLSKSSLLPARKWLKGGFLKHGSGTLANPEQVVDGHRGRLVAHKRIFMEDKERLLRVVYEETESQIIVVTAYLTSDIRRYWKDTP